MKTQPISISPNVRSNLVLRLALIGIIGACGFRLSAESSYVAHEWGTFTSIQGGDGKLLDWNGVATAELPAFVYNWSHPGLGRRFGFGGKISLMGTQRLETPVLYFYPDQPMRVDVAVRFPKGQITEWFPQAREVGPSTQAPSAFLTALDRKASDVGLHLNPSLAARFGTPPLTNSLIHWSNFEALPAGQQPDLARLLPTAAKANHYFAARDTQSAFVRIDSMEKTNRAPEFEKFLFYRGVGNFATPIHVTVSGAGQITIANPGHAPLEHLFALAVHGQQASFAPLGSLAVAQTRQVTLNSLNPDRPLNTVVQAISRQMADALVAEGLYRAEAEAMVKTWQDAWFQDQGVRILYLLPRSWTDQILPMTLAPKPRELVRVMVGRSELITPRMEAQVRRCVNDFSQSDVAKQQTAVRHFKAMKLGRFATAAMRLAARDSQDHSFFGKGMKLIQAAAVTKATEASTAELLTPQDLVASGR